MLTIDTANLIFEPTPAILRMPRVVLYDKMNILRSFMALFGGGEAVCLDLTSLERVYGKVEAPSA